jgi:hypothetical protein
MRQITPNPIPNDGDLCVIPNRFGLQAIRLRFAQAEHQPSIGTYSAEGPLSLAVLSLS